MRSRPELRGPDLKILILYETVYPDAIGGVETRNYELAGALARRGHEVTLAGYCSQPAPPPGVEVLSLGPTAGLYNREGKRSTRQALRFAARVARLDLGRFDVVETPNMPYVHLLPLAARCALAGKPLVVTWYEYWGAYWKGYVGRVKAPAYRGVEWLTAQLGAAVTATSRLTEGRLAARRLRGQVELVPCGIGVERVRRATEEGVKAGGTGAGEAARYGVHLAAGVHRAEAAAHRDADRAGGADRGEDAHADSDQDAGAARGEAGSAPPLLYAGRLLTHKRLDLLLGAVARLSAMPAGQGIPAGPLLTVFGEGPDRPRLERMAADLGIAGRVVFRGHVATSEEVWSELGRARLAVQPSAREGFGLFPLEAMAAGLPVVYCESPESAVAELVRHGIEGIATPAYPEALVAGIAPLLADPAAHARLAEAARARASQYDWGEIARQIEEVCERLLAGRPQRKVRRTA